MGAILIPFWYNFRTILEVPKMYPFWTNFWTILEPSLGCPKISNSFYIFVNFTEFWATPVWPQKMTTFCRCFERQPPWGAQNWPKNHENVVFLIILGSILGLSWSPSLAPQEGVIFWWMSLLISIFRLFFAASKASRFVSFCHHF